MQITRRQSLVAALSGAAGVAGALIAPSVGAAALPVQEPPPVGAIKTGDNRTFQRKNTPWEKVGYELITFDQQKPGDYMLLSDWQDGHITRQEAYIVTSEVKPASPTGVYPISVECEEISLDQFWGKSVIFGERGLGVGRISREAYICWFGDIGIDIDELRVHNIAPRLLPILSEMGAMTSEELGWLVQFSYANYLPSVAESLVSGVIALTNSPTQRYHMLFQMGTQWGWRVQGWEYDPSVPGMARLVKADFAVTTGSWMDIKVIGGATRLEQLLPIPLPPHGYGTFHKAGANNARWSSASPPVSYTGKSV